MIAVISVLSFLMAFGAIWFTTEALKRVDNYNDARFRPHLNNIYRSIDETEKTLRGFKERVELLERQVHTLKLKTDHAPALQQEAGTLRADIQKAQQGIPSVRLNG
ncbi:MAG: hypothetical protein ISR51_05605 [Rhodospirillales bacterium]|nr:hypothetical protein [Alphaproteobacteria bacterium]MBL6948134.1 hypothetical protein [Rhodospirillales bacterium]